MIVYLDIRKNNVLVIKVTLGSIDNKYTLPKSIITEEGIVDGTVKNQELFLDSISFSKFEDSPKLNKLDELLSKLNDTDIVYATSIETKERVALLGLNKTYPLFKKYTMVGTIFMEELRAELSRIVDREDFVIDMTEYLKAKRDVHTLLGDTTNMFFFQDMNKGIYYTYHNKESKSGKNDSIDVQKTKIVLGKKASTNTYQVYNIGEQVEIDNLYAKWRDKNEYDLYCIMLMNRFKSSRNVYYDKIDSLIYSKNPNQFRSPTDEVLISEILPAGISYYAFKEFKMLEKMLSEFNSEEESVVKNSTIEITDRVFEKTDKGVKIIHPSNFTLTHNYNVKGKDYKIILDSGLDMPNRNLMNHLGKLNPRLYLVIINENDVCCRHYTVLKTDVGDVITGAIPTNLTLLENTK